MPTAAFLAPPHLYAAIVIDVTDGDGIVVDEDHGRSMWLRGQDYRLHGGNAREKRDPLGGREAITNLQQIRGRRILLGSLKPGKDVEPDKYGGRWQARITIDAGGQPADLTALLIASGWMCPWNGTGPKPVPAWPIPPGTPTFEQLLRDGLTPPQP